MAATAVLMETETFTSQGIVDDTRRGLLDDPKWLSSLYFYDEAGSHLFEQICDTPEYYPTRTEAAILEAHAQEILDAAGSDLVLAELGSGSSSKTRIVLDNLLKSRGPSTYLPVDISGDFLHAVAQDLHASFKGLTVSPIAAEYKDGLQQIGDFPASRRLVLFLGSSIGNFEPPEQVGLLRAAFEALSPGDAFLLGTDLVKPQELLEAAYDDAAGVTAAFNKNILTHLNRELGGNADIDYFEHRAIWNAEESRIEMHLVSRMDQALSFPAADLYVELERGETIHTENSYKFTPERAAQLAKDAGFTLEKTWTDDKAWFGLHLLRRG